MYIPTISHFYLRKNRNYRALYDARLSLPVTAFCFRVPEFFSALCSQITLVYVIFSASETKCHISFKGSVTIIVHILIMRFIEFYGSVGFSSEKVKMFVFLKR